MASPGNQHFANCIGTLSFPIEQAICLTGNHRIIYQHISQLTHIRWSLQDYSNLLFTHRMLLDKDDSRRTDKYKKF